MRHLKIYLENVEKVSKPYTTKEVVGKVDVIKTHQPKPEFKNVLCFRNTPKRRVENIIKFVRNSNTISKIEYGHEPLNV